MEYNRQDIDILISKFLSGEAEPEEAIFLEDWKAESPENLEHFRGAEQLFHLTQDRRAPQQPDVAAAWKKIAPQLEAQPKAKMVRMTPAFFRMAASFLILIGIGGSIGYYFLKQPAGDVFASAGQGQYVALKDGSQVEVAPHSSISLDAGFGKSNRRVRLKGSAYFTVDHNEGMPFIIEAGDVFIKDLGTKFDVRDQRDTLVVRVDEGVVSVYDNHGQEKTLKAGEKAYYLKKRHQLVSEASQYKAPEPKPVKLDFVDQKLSEVVKVLSKAYGERVTLDNAALGDLTITTKFENEPLEVVLSIITETLGLKYATTDKGYIIQAK